MEQKSTFREESTDSTKTGNSGKLPKTEFDMAYLESEVEYTSLWLQRYGLKV